MRKQQEALKFVEDPIIENGSVQNTVHVSDEMENNSFVDSDSRCDSFSDCLIDSTEEKNQQLRDGLKHWAINYNISHEAIKSLIVLINDRIPNTLRADPRTLFNTEKSVTTQPVGSASTITGTTA